MLLRPILIILFVSEKNLNLTFGWDFHELTFYFFEKSFDYEKEPHSLHVIFKSKYCSTIIYLINYSRNKKDKVIPWIHQAGVITKMNFSAFDDFYNFAISNLLIKM